MLHVEVEVAVDLEVERERPRPRREPRLLQRERRHLTEPSYLPEQEDEECGNDGRAARESLAPASGNDVRQHGSAGDEKVRRLERRRCADQDAGEHGIA